MAKRYIIQLPLKTPHDLSKPLVPADKDWAAFELEDGRILVMFHGGRDGEIGLDEETMRYLVEEADLITCCHPVRVQQAHREIERKILGWWTTTTWNCTAGQGKYIYISNLRIPQQPVQISAIIGAKE